MSGYSTLSFLPLVPADYSFLRQLYETSFPPFERRNWNQLVNMFNLPGMQVIIAKQGEKPVGFAIYWSIKDWYFLEHLAIDPLQEGKGIGSAFMQWLLEQSGHRLLLETELPADAIGRRRIRFYEKLGLSIAPFFYQQPPYRRNETTPAMHIMSVPQITNAGLFTMLTDAIRLKVFEAFY